MATNALALPSQLPRIPGNDGVEEKIRALLGDAVLSVSEPFGDLTVVVRRDAIRDALEKLAAAPDLAYEQLLDICGVDYPERDERFEVVYHLLSLRHNRRLRVKLSASEESPVPSVVALFPCAGWQERETFDCYGVFFEGNPDLRRLLTDYGFEGHPFRKDFPLTGHVEMRYSEEQGRVIYEPVKLKQDFRSFDFLSPWEGNWNVPDFPGEGGPTGNASLPGDEKAKK